MNNPLNDYVGRIYTFDDGNSIKIKEIKRRDENSYWVKYEIKTGPGIPRQHAMIWEEFKNNFGHLFP